MTYVKVDPCSTRLGNWMFQYAAAKCAAPNEAVTFVISGDQDMDAVRRYACLWPDAQYVREAPEGAAVRVGLFQDVKYVDRKMVKDLFLNKLSSFVEPSTFNLQPLVSVHVRRGDYMKLPHRHPFVGKKYLREAVSRFPDAEFMVFSDDMPWCKQFFRGARFHFTEGNSVLTDLYLMTQCQGGHICSNSTFSWWGAFLGEGKAIFPGMWYGPAVKGVAWQGLYYEGCGVLENGYSPGLWLMARAYMVKNACGYVLRKEGLK